MTKFIYFKLASVLLLLLVSCSGRTPTAADRKLKIPTQFTSGSRTWKNVSMTDDIKSKLSAYLEEKTEYQSHPAMQSEPVVFRADSGEVSVYWIPPYAEKPIWLKYSSEDSEPISEGTGEPFPSTLTQDTE